MEVGQLPLLIAHCKMVVPVAIPVNGDVARLVDVILAVPDTILHKPDPIVGKLAPNVVVLAQIV